MKFYRILLGSCCMGMIFFSFQIQSGIRKFAKELTASVAKEDAEAVEKIISFLDQIDDLEYKRYSDLYLLKDEKEEIDCKIKKLKDDLADTINGMAEQQKKVAYAASTEILEFIRRRKPVLLQVIIQELAK